MTIKKPASVKQSQASVDIDRVINAGSPPVKESDSPTPKDIKFQMAISPELCQSIDEARKLSKTSRRAWLLQAAQEKLEREGKLK
jgi:hypothetical protein